MTPKWVSWAALGALVFQNCAAVLMMRWTQTQRTGPPYSAAAIVLVTEIAKLVGCLAAMRFNGQPFAEVGTGVAIMGVPAFLYCLLNNLLYVATANLEATLFQVTYQTKLLATALLMNLLLGHKLSRRKWLALALLFFGIVLTQLDAQNSARSTTRENSQDIVTGLVAVLCAVAASAFASVYFEKIVKAPNSSLIIRNVQLAGYSILIAFATYVSVEGTDLGRLLYGFDVYVWILVAIQAAGGLIVAAVIKYADNLWKGFATAIAIVVSGIFSFIFMGFHPQILFVSGVVLVVGSTGLYALPEPPPSAPVAP
jgi:UDP-sugar transporter A1/2/3